MFRRLLLPLCLCVYVLSLEASEKLEIENQWVRVFRVIQIELK